MFHRVLVRLVDGLQPDELCDLGLRLMRGERVVVNQLEFAASNEKKEGGRGREGEGEETNLDIVRIRLESIHEFVLF